VIVAISWSVCAPMRRPSLVLFKAVAHPECATLPGYGSTVIASASRIAHGHDFAGRAARHCGRSHRAPSASAEPGDPREVCSRMTSKRSGVAALYISQSPLAPRTEASSPDEFPNWVRTAAQNAAGVITVVQSSNPTYRAPSHGALRSPRASLKVNPATVATVASVLPRSLTTVLHRSMVCGRRSRKHAVSGIEDDLANGDGEVVLSI
jgi:hypothetical protein